MKIKNPFKDLSRFELCLWLTSVSAVVIPFLVIGERDYLNSIASVIGVTALIFVAKGYVLGQLLTVVFSVFYGIISYHFTYYGEMITYLFMTAPAAVMATISWIRNPYDSKEVKVRRLRKRHIISLTLLCTVLTVIFYFILSALGNANMLFSTISITTSALASSLTFLRSPYYALAYAANDIVLIVLWGLATIESITYLPMIICFVMFLANDIYGFYNWKKMQKTQS